MEDKARSKGPQQALNQPQKYKRTSRMKNKMLKMQCKTRFLANCQKFQHGHELAKQTNKKRGAK